MNSRLLLCFTLFTSSLAVADDRRSIEVTAQSSIKVVPDEVRLGLAVDITAETLLEAKQKNDDISAAIIALAPNFKVLPADVEVANMHVSPNFRRSSSFGREAGGKPISYDFKRSVEMRLTDFDQLEPLLTAAFQAGLTNVSHIQFRVSNQRKHQFKAREQAVQFAKEKADHLVSLTNMKLGSPITIHEDVEYNYRGGGFGGTAAFSYHDRTRQLKKYILASLDEATCSDERPKSQLLAPGQVTLHATVKIVYEMTLP